MFLVAWGDDPIGQVRIELDSNRWLLDYSMDREYRGRGLAAKALVLAFKEVYELGIRKVYAEVVLENVRSLRTLQSVGFTQERDAHSELHLLSMQLSKAFDT
jgi:RimJ/RimL family protein N-acetyltransferase